MFPHDPTKFIQLLDPGDFIPAEDNANPGFTQLVTDTLGEGATPADGFDQVYADAQSIADAVDAGLGLLDGEYEGAFSDAGAVDPQPFADTAANVHASLAPADAAFADLGNLIPGGAPAPDSPAAPTGGAPAALSHTPPPAPAIPSPTPAL